MPAAFYTSADFLAAETEEVLRREFLCVGHVGEVRNPGDFFTTELLGEQLLVVRDMDGGVRVLSNVCRHRGNRVAEGRGNARKFVCQYHNWAYDTAGALKVAPRSQASIAVRSVSPLAVPGSTSM